VALMTDSEIRDALASGDIELSPLAEEALQPASYDLRMGERAIISRTPEIQELRDRIVNDEAPEIDVASVTSFSIPAGGFALIVTKERVRLSLSYAGHIGLRSYFARKGLLLLAGLQVDPGFNGYLVLGLANLSPRSIPLHHEEPIATLELHRLDRPASQEYEGQYAGQQETPTIPRADADYLRTIETLSVSDLTRSLLRLSDNVATLTGDVATLTRDVRLLWIPLGIAIVVAILTRAF
jgi:dCTP deaminase